MRIALDGRTIADHFPGIGRYTYNLAAALARCLPPGDELVVLHDSRQPNTHFDLAALGAQRTLRLLDLSARNFSLSEQWRVPGALRRLGADVYHSPYLVMPYRPGCPSAVTLHDLIPLRAPSSYSPTARLIFAVTVRLAIRATRRVITVSHASAIDLQQRLGVAASRLAVIPSGPDPIFQPQSAEAVARVRARYRLADDYVLYMGSNMPHKNLPRLVRAFAQVSSPSQKTPLVIAGHWDERFPDAKADAASAPGRVLFLGPVLQADLPALYAGATLFVFPSLYEGFGQPPLEAMACGAPVACSNAAALSEVVGEAALYFDPLDETAIANTISGALRDGELRAALAARGLRRAREFTWSRAAQQTLAVYHGLVGAAP